MKIMCNIIPEELNIYKDQKNCNIIPEELNIYKDQKNCS